MHLPHRLDPRFNATRIHGKQSLLATHSAVLRYLAVTSGTVAMAEERDGAHKDLKEQERSEAVCFLLAPRGVCWCRQHFRRLSRCHVQSSFSRFGRIQRQSAALWRDQAMPGPGSPFPATFLLGMNLRKPSQNYAPWPGRWRAGTRLA